MIETKTKVIDGLTFSSTQLPPLKAYPLSARVGGILLPAFGKFMALGIKDAEKFFELDAAKLFPILEPVLSALGRAENEDLPGKLLAGTMVQMADERGEMSLVYLNTPEGINRAFQGRGMTLYKALWFAVEVNFSDFMPGARSPSQTKASAETAVASA